MVIPARAGMTPWGLSCFVNNRYQSDNPCIDAKVPPQKRPKATTTFLLDKLSGIADTARTVARLYSLLSAFKDRDATAAIKVFAI